MKPCKHCAVIKPLDDFYKHLAMSDGHLNVCKACRDIYVKQWNLQNKEKRKAIANKYARANRSPERSRASFEKWWPSRNKARRAELQRRRDAQKLKAIPAWADEWFIAEAYDIANRRTALTGISWEVDHIVPLQSPLVCGLHVIDNLRVIPAALNRSKRNYYWPDMPEKTA